MTSALPSRARGAGIAGTTIAHGALVALALLAARRGTANHTLVYEVNLVAAPLPSAGVKTAPDTKAPVPKAVTPPVKRTPDKAVPKPVPSQPAKPAAPPLVKAPPVLAQGEKPSTGHESVTLHQEGVAFPFPEYLTNIESMIYKRWNHSSFRPGFETRIAFVISKDGSVAPGSYEVVKSSGNSVFDENARAAIESVVANHEFGPLPNEFNGPSLSILFVFTQVRSGAP